MEHISIDLKKRCVAAADNGMNSHEIYDQIFHPEHSCTSLDTFKRLLRKWKKKYFPDDRTLYAGTYDGFTAHAATVQVNGEGDIVQAWIKQTIDDGQWERLLEAIKENTEPSKIEPRSCSGEGMLEIPLYDMHLPLSDHAQTIAELLSIIYGKQWDEINITIGQDMFHNDDFRGRTSSGTPIERVDMAKAWEMAKRIWYNVIEACLSQCPKVNLIYSAGNHDESMSWAFVQLLKDHFPQIRVDDELKQRKCVYWNGCFIGLTHGYNKMSKVNDLRGQFTIEFASEFSMAKVREIHCGHLHHEKEGDLYGVMIRRLSRNGTTDQWSEDNGFVGAHKRFMVFEWMPDRLKAIYYI